MKLIKLLTIGLAALGLFGFASTIGNQMPLSATVNMAPASYTTQSGGTGGQQVSHLTVMDQSGTSDDPARYVSFTTPGTVYRGYRRYFLPGGLSWSSLTSLTVKVNYKGPAAATQTWSWYLYDWSAKKWIKLGDNTPALAGRWKLFSFGATRPARFINGATREIRVQLLSNNASENAKLDYESVSLGYNPIPTTTLTRTITLTPTITTTPTITSTPTITFTPTITLTPSATPSVVHFAAVGDYGVDNADEAAVATLVKSWNPDFIITVGDNNYLGGDAGTIDQNIGKYYHEYIYPYTGAYGAGSPGFNRFFPSLGNHDWSSAGVTPYMAYFTLPGNERYYDFGRGPVHFFVIDSDPQEPDGTSSTSTQAVWLQTQLAAATEPWKIVYFHHPPYSSSSVHGSSAWMQWDFKGWGASIVLAGHDHTYERLDVGGFPYIVNGLGGQTLYAFGASVAGSLVQYNAKYGAMLIDASVAQITFQFISTDGITQDTFSLP